VGVDEVHFGYRTFGDASISGRAYLDLDGDGRYDANIDTPLGGLTLSLETMDGEPLATATSSPNGGYSFSNLASGQYRLILAQPPGGYSGSLEQTVSVPLGNINVTANFPCCPTTSSRASSFSWTATATASRTPTSSGWRARPSPSLTPPAPPRKRRSPRP
jgi:hypothetical protein